MKISFLLKRMFHTSVKLTKFPVDEIIAVDWFLSAQSRCFIIAPFMIFNTPHDEKNPSRAEVFITVIYDTGNTRFIDT